MVGRQRPPVRQYQFGINRVHSDELERRLSFFPLCFTVDSQYIYKTLKLAICKRNRTYALHLRIRRRRITSSTARSSFYVLALASRLAGRHVVHIHAQNRTDDGALSHLYTRRAASQRLYTRRPNWDDINSNARDASNANTRSRPHARPAQQQTRSGSAAQAPTSHGRSGRRYTRRSSCSAPSSANSSRIDDCRNHRASGFQ